MLPWWLSGLERWSWKTEIVGSSPTQGSSYVCLECLHLHALLWFMYMYILVYLLHVRSNGTLDCVSVLFLCCVCYRYGLHLLQCTESCEDSGELVGGWWAGVQSAHLRGEEKGDPTGVPWLWWTEEAANTLLDVYWSPGFMAETHQRTWRYEAEFCGW